MRDHFIIPDTQAGPDRPLDHMAWIGEFFVEKYSGRDDVRLIHLGDHADMASLSMWDVGKKSSEGRRVQDDFDAANESWAVLNEPIRREQLRLKTDARRLHKKVTPWEPDRHILEGNHENRIERACEADAKLEGFLNVDLLSYEYWGWQRHKFLDVIELDGVAYSHYFANPMTGRPYGGANIQTRLRTIGTSFTMGHQQGLWSGIDYDALGRQKRGLVAGSCYLHDEEYRSTSANRHWRGIIRCFQVEGGSYDLSEISLDFLCRKYEGVSLQYYMTKKYPKIASWHA